ncbi:MAG: hypothetical protein ACUVQR_06955 [Thermogutta sp.]
MSHEHSVAQNKIRPHCCPCCDASGLIGLGELSRRTFIGGATLGAALFAGVSWAKLVEETPELPMPPPRLPLKVKPVFLYHVYQPRPQTSWRYWGGIQTEEAAAEEVTRIQEELQKLQAAADFPLEIADLTATKNAGELGQMPDVQSADALLVYANDGDLNAIAALKKDTVFFIRHKSGPIYLYYEIINPRFLRQHTDELKVPGMDNDDVVIDNYDEVLWRLRALCGLKNARNQRIIAVGGPAAWGQPPKVVPELVQKIWNTEIIDLPYPELGKMIEAARADQAAVNLAKRRAKAYFQDNMVRLETDPAYVENAFLLDQVFRKVMAQANCRMITINGCMGTIMPIAQTTACLTLSTLNDDGYLAFCESDFVVIPAGMLMCGISGLPPFLNDPTYPHDGIITLAHCTAPRKMNGKEREPARILTHFESDYGAAPKVEMRNGQIVTNILPDFKSERWVGLRGEIVAHPFLPICRSQIDIKYTCDDKLLADRMHGFHWMTIYGDYIREAGYALKRVGIKFEVLG